MSQTWPLRLTTGGDGWTLDWTYAGDLTELERFQTALGVSHTIATRVDVLEAGEVIATLDVSDGTVTLDQTAQVRGRADITVNDPDLAPTDAESLLAPYGNELRVWRGVAFPDGTEYLVSLGVFRIDESTVTDTAQGVEVHVTGMDRSARMIDARFEEPYTVAAGTNVATAIEECAQAAWPAVTTNLTATSLTTPLLVGEEGGDRWKFMQDLAAGLGHALFFDGDGVLTSRPVASPTGTPSVVFAEGAGGVLLSAARRWSRQGTYNRVIATGENPAEGAVPARGVATDDNPLSPTYYYGPYGKVPRFYASQFLVNDSQAIDAAQAILNRELGTTQQVDFGALVNPALQPDDLVSVTRERLGLAAETHVIDSITIPLAADQAMSGRTRAVVS